jgi:large subunit ribosomal protein L18e
MARRTGPTNPVLRKLINLLEKQSRENNAPVWAAIAEKLRCPRRRRIEVNLGKINKLYKEDKLIVVPGKVLGDGKLDKPVKVAAFKFSTSASKRIEEAGGKAMRIEEAMRLDPKGSNVIIVA